MNKTSALVLAASVAIAAVLTPQAKADLIFHYDGPLFTDTFPSVGGIDFTTADRITGTVVFDNAMSTQAKTIQLSTTVGGNPGCEFNIPDTTSPGAFNIATNNFTFAGNDLVAWDLTIDGEVFGGVDGFETLSISSLAGDLATIDFGGTLQADALTFSTGQFTAAAVPEPSGFIVCAMGLGLTLAKRVSRKKLLATDDTSNIPPTNPTC
ncbi:MAG: PEP-CTERM sorting domain-containing protein [Aureliella sp.]